MSAPPKTVEELFDRKRKSRSRFDGMPLIEKMEMAILWHRDLTAFKSTSTRRPPGDTGGTRRVS